MLIGCSQSIASSAEIKPVNLRTEYKRNPVTDTRKPRLSWELTSAGSGQRQTAYQLLVATSPGLRASDKADLWNSTNVPGAATSQIDYTGQPGPWSATASWAMCLLSKSDWIGINFQTEGKCSGLVGYPLNRYSCSKTA